MLYARMFASSLAAGALLCCAAAAQAQVPQYGTSVNAEQARKMLVGAVAEARKVGVPMAIAIVDNAGQLVAFERMDNTQTGSIGIAPDKAMSAAMFRRPTKAFQDALAAGGAGLRILNLRGVSASEGGLPIVLDGKIIGGIGVSGGSGEQDAEVARGGLAALK
jgi:glc operon protein GlcG